MPDPVTRDWRDNPSLYTVAEAIWESDHQVTAHQHPNAFMRIDAGEQEVYRRRAQAALTAYKDLLAKSNMRIVSEGRAERRTLKLARRDRVIVPLVNGLLRLASPDYRNFVDGAIRYGMRAAARDSDD